MLQMTNQQEQGWLDAASLQRFPCDALETLDKLWTDASDSKFGFSVQHNLYTSTCSKIAATDGINQDSYACFIDQVGWTRVWDTAQDDLQVTYNVDAPAGHLPWKALCGPDYCDASQDELNRYWALQSRLTSCQSK